MGDEHKPWGEFVEGGSFSIALVTEILLRKGILSKEEYKKVRQYIENGSPSYNKALEGILRMISEE